MAAAGLSFSICTVGMLLALHTSQGCQEAWVKLCQVVPNMRS